MRAIQAVQDHTFTGFGGVAAIGLAVYLGMVVYHGNTQKLLNQLVGEFSFIKWGLSLVVLWIIIQELGGGIGASIGFIAFMALALTAGSKIFPQIETFFKKV